MGDLDVSTSQAVALAGRLPVKVSTENGTIAIGDVLTSASSTSGVAMKATKAGRVIGIALESLVQCSNETMEQCKIMVFVNPHWIGNDLSVGQDDSGQIVNLSTEQFRSGLASLGLIVNENGVLEVDTLETRKLCVGSVCVTEAEFKAVFGEGVGSSSSSPATVEIGGTDTGSTPTTTSTTTPTTTPSTTTYYLDFDSDGYGNASSSTSTCEQPAGYIIDSTDCNDTNEDINPNATEICDGLDNNCNGEIDEGGVCDVCDAIHLNLCSTETDCQGGGGYWYNEQCNGEPE